MEYAYCLHGDKDEYVLDLLKSEIRYREICPRAILENVDNKINWLEKECERRGIHVSISI